MTPTQDWIRSCRFVEHLSGSQRSSLLEPERTDIALADLRDHIATSLNLSTILVEEDKSLYQGCNDTCQYYELLTW
ncbi:hypothetical protein TNIN_76351 [Trichonephila inaurata madagascariensis]|uniref:Uncharacterized protein n=1 Tax=Trichonephila inaurata madagascariensis TaxID=2747483 RepID=A0A8X7C7Q5_9ARAC|nr:hypothetical protein TNIN_76351 [Trichonephila inaurata madagascariensis]